MATNESAKDSASSIWFEI